MTQADKYTPIGPCAHRRIHRLFLLATAVGVLAIIIAAVFGIQANRSSRIAQLDALAYQNKLVSHQLVAELETTDAVSVQADLSYLLDRWTQFPNRHQDAYLHVIGNDGRLLAHTKRPELVGQQVGRSPIPQDAAIESRSVAELLKAQESWAGKNTNLEGQDQLAAYTYSDRLDGLVVVHTPLSAYASAVNASSLPWTVSYFATILGLWPLCLLLTHLCFRRYHKNALRDEARLKAQFCELEHVYANAPIGLALLDTELRIVRCNKAMSDIIGRTDDVNDRLKLHEICPWAADKFEPVLRKVIESGQAVKDFEISLEDTGQREAFYYLVNCHPMKSEKGEVNGIGAVVQDITSRKQMENALIKREALFRALVENSFDVINLFSDEGDLLYTSPSMKNVLGYKPSEIIGQPGVDIIHPDDLEQCMQDFGLSIDDPSRIAHVKHRLRHKDGTYRVVECLGRNMLGVEGVNAMFSVFRDVTKREEAEKALAQSESRFRSLCLNAPVGIFLCDTEGLWTYVNDQVREIAKAGSFEELLGTGWTGFLHPDDMKSVIHDWVRAGKNRQLFDREYRYISSDGKVSWVQCKCVPQEDHKGTLIGFIGTLVDITEHKRAREDLQASESRFRTLVEHAAEAIVILDVESQKFVDANDNALTLFGCDMETLRHFGPADLSPPLQPNGQSSVLAAKKMIELALAGHNPVFEWIHWDTSQNQFECEIRLVQIPSTTQKLLRGCVTDITERKRVEAKIREQQLQLAHVSRLSTMGEMVAGIAHEVNQPLSSVTNFANACCKVLAQEHPDRERLREWMNDIRSEAMRAGEIIKRIGNFTRRGDDQRTLVDLNQLIADTVSLVSFHINRQAIWLQLVLTEQPAVVMGDRVQLQQVLINLIRNACEATEGVDPPNRCVTIKTLPEGDQWIVEISDRGIGLPVDHEELIFDAFFTTKPEGMGMGLGISRTIVEGHDGQMFAKSNLDRGTTVGFSIPAVPDNDADRKDHSELHRICR